MPKKSAQDKKTGARNVLKTVVKTRVTPSRTYSIARRTPRSINELISQHSVLGRITHKVSAQKSWTEWLREVLPGELAAHIVYAIPKQSELVVFADTSSWSVRLRYALAGLLMPIQLRDPAIQRTQVRVQPPA